MHSVFRIDQVKQINGDIPVWQVSLTLTSDTDSQLHDLTARIREETYPTTKGWYRLGHLLMKLGQFDKAQQVFDIMLEETLDQGEKANIDRMLELVKRNQGKYTEAVKYYEKALEIRQKTLPANHPDLATTYNNIGAVYDNMGEYSKTLSYLYSALEILERSLPANHPHLEIVRKSIKAVEMKL